jgi:hypothetical protein
MLLTLTVLLSAVKRIYECSKMHIKVNDCGNFNYLLIIHPKNYASLVMSLT